MGLNFEGDQTRHELQAAYFEGLIDLKRFRTAHPHYSVLALNPLVVELARGQYGVLTKFGAVIGWNADAEHFAGLTRAVAGLPGTHARDDRVQDTLLVLVNAAAPTAPADAHFNALQVRDLTLEKLKIIALSLGQSVALEHFELNIDKALAEITPRVETLRSSGGLRGGERKVLRDIGFVLTVRAQVLANLTLFDKPPEAWESEAIERLDNLLYDHFDLEERLSAINQKVAFLNDLNSTFLGVLNHRKTVRLEWIVVLLIAVEIVMGLMEALRK